VSQKIAIVISASYGGGAEKSMQLIHERLRTLNFESLLISINKTSSYSTQAKHEINLGRSQRAGHIKTLLCAIKLNYQLFRFKPSVLILNCEIAEVLGVLSFRRKLRLFVVEHANPSWEGRRALGFLVRRLLIARGTRFIAVSSHIKPPFELHNYESVIPNPLGSTVSNNVHATSEEMKRIVYIGRLTSVHKNPEQMLHISSATGLPVVFIGVGEMMSQLKILAKKFGVSAEFSGWVKNPWNLIGAHDLVIVPSEHEGDGLVVVEAILRQVPLLLSDIPDFRRFNLPNINYCASLSEFVSTTEQNRNSLSSLRPPLKAKQILEEHRNIDKVVDSWIRTLSL